MSRGGVAGVVTIVTRHTRAVTVGVVPAEAPEN